MPCRDESYSPPTSVLAETQHKLRTVEAMLCAIVTALRRRKGTLVDDIVYHEADWQRAGVTRDEFEAWLVDHIQRDRARLAREQEERRKEQIKQDAIAKLTLEERTILGV